MLCRRLILKYASIHLMNLVAITLFSSPFLFDLAIFMAEEQGEKGGKLISASPEGPVAVMHGQLWKHRVGKGRNQEVSRAPMKVQWVFAMLQEVR